MNHPTEGWRVALAADMSQVVEIQQRKKLEEVSRQFLWHWREL